MIFIPTLQSRVISRIFPALPVTTFAGNQKIIKFFMHRLQPGGWSTARSTGQRQLKWDSSRAMLREFAWWPPAGSRLVGLHNIGIKGKSARDLPNFIWGFLASSNNVFEWNSQSAHYTSPFSTAEHQRAPYSNLEWSYACEKSSVGVHFPPTTFHTDYTSVISLNS